MDGAPLGVPILTPGEMADVDREASDPVEVLINRAGSALARSARAMLGGTYGRRVAVIAGQGNNGNDGRVAAQRLERWGARVVVHDARAGPERITGADLVIDAAYGTGLKRPYEPPATGPTPVLAADIPSGVDGVTGELHGRPLFARRTLSFAALKPGLLLEPGRRRAGEVTVADIGLDVSRARAHLLTDDAARHRLPHRAVDAHKWRSACWVVAGSPGMTGAAHLAARAAQRAGAGYVRLSTPGIEHDPLAPTESVGLGLPANHWDRDVLAGADRMHAMVVGPGLGRSAENQAAVRALLAAAQLPVVVDGDGLTLLGDAAPEVLRRRSAPTVLTPHDGEFEAMVRRRPKPDRFAEVRAMAAWLGVHVLLKGPTTLVGAPDGEVVAVTVGDARLATAGTGDVLAGIIGGLLAAGADTFDATAAGAHLHGLAARLAPPNGLVASDLVDLLPAAMDQLG